MMLTDTEAEHIPGCNMAFYKWALDEIHGFDPVFRKAGDDVDLCWRLQESGYKIGFAAGALVWHYRRSTVNAYLKQQAGYGEAEALLQQKHPEYFNVLGNSVWHGRIYAAGLSGIVLQRSVVYHGVFGSAFFQKLYTRDASFALMVCTSLQFHVFVIAPSLIVAGWQASLLPLAALALFLPVAVCVGAAAQAELPPDRTRWWSRPLVALLFFLQPIVRGWARYKRRLVLVPAGRRATESESVPMLSGSSVCFWSQNHERYTLMAALQQKLLQDGWEHRIDSGWDEFDFEIVTKRWSIARITTVQEELAQGRRFFRCRIDTRASWTSRALFVLVMVAACCCAALLREEQPYAWFALAAIPFVLLFVALEENAHANEVAALIGGVAERLGLREWKGEAMDGIHNTEKTESSTVAPANALSS